MRGTAAPFRPSRRLLLSSSLVTAAVALAPAAARGQAFQGAPTVASGVAAIDRATPGVDTITQSTPVAVINWTTADTGVGGGAINFLPAGTTANYRTDGSALTGTYTTINRILPTDPSRQIALNGTVTSMIVGASGAATPGGQIWFYSPGGLLIGASGVFNVGSLLLTANNPTITNGTPYAGADNAALFGAANNSMSTVEILPGATINATQPGSYVALIAPRVAQGGAVRVNGQAAYVAAESVSISFKAPGQLFDISLGGGSFVDPANPGDNIVLRHTGTTTGPASTGSTDPHAIYMATQAKNLIVKALLQVNGQFGFDSASNAAVENGSIVLSAGSSIANGAIGSTLIGLGNMTVPVADFAVTGAGTISSRVVASARRRFDLTTSGSASLAVAANFGVTTSSPLGDGFLNVAVADTSTLTFGGDLSLNASASSYLDIPTSTTVPIAGGTAQIVVAAGGTLNVARGVTLNAAGFGTPAKGGTATIASAGTVSFGSLVMSATGNRFATQTTDAGSGSGGIAAIATTGGSFRVVGTASVDASGSAGAGSSAQGVGGVASLSVGGGTATFGQLNVSANGTGSSGDVGGIGQAGAARVAVTGGGATFAGLSVQANATGGSGAAGFGGGAIPGSGEAALRVSGGGSATVTGNASISAVANGGAGSAGGGNASGGTALASTGGGTLILGSVALNATGTGGRATAGGPGGSGAGGGTALLTVAGGPATDMIRAGSVSLSSAGTGGAAAGTGGAQAGGGAVGGSGRISAGAGGIVLAGAVVNAGASAGQGAAGGAGGDALGGVATGETIGGALTTTSYSASTFALAGAGGNGPAGGAGGAATGGTAQLLATSGTLATGATATLNGGGRGGNGGTGATGAGGAGGAARGGTSIALGTGGAITGGTATASGGNSVSVTAAATGGGGGAGFGDGGPGGTGTGGAATVESRVGGGSVVLSNLAIDAGGVGGSGGSSTGIGAGGAGGIGSGGDARLLAGGPLGASNLRIDADGAGGSGGTGGSDSSATGARAGGAGGFGFGGLAYAGASAATLTLTGAASVIDSSATGGSGGGGGLSAGGTIRGIGGAGGDATVGLGPISDGFRHGAYLVAQGGTILFSNSDQTEVQLSGFASGGRGGIGSIGGAGGTGRAGLAQVLALGSPIRGASAFLTASGSGGFGGAGSDPAGGGAGGRGGDGSGGFALVSTDQSAAASITLDGLRSYTDGNGGFGGAGGSGSTQGGAGGAGGIGNAGVTQLLAATGAVAIADVFMDPYAIGGQGGAGGAAANGIGGAGGAGGSAFAALDALDAAGGAASIGTLGLYSLVVGGDGGGGGSGATAGQSGGGGGATGGVVRLAAGPGAGAGAAGSLTTGAAQLDTTLIGGIGRTNGAAAGGRIQVQAQTAPVTIASIATDIEGDVAIDLLADAATLTVTGPAMLQTAGAATLRTANGGVLSAGDVDLAAGSVLIDQAGAAPADGLPGLRTISIDADVAGDFTATGAIRAAADVDLAAGGAMNVRDVTAVDGALELAAGGDIRAGNLSAGDSITLTTPAGSVSAGRLVAGTTLPDPADPDASEYVGGVGIDANGDVTVGPVSARSLIAFGSRTGSIAAGALAAGDDVLLLAAGSVTTGAITTAPTIGAIDPDANGGVVYIGNVSALPAFDTFDIVDPDVLAGILDAGLLPVGGSVATGPIAAAGAVTAAARTTLRTGAIQLAGSLQLASGGDLAIGAIRETSGAGDASIDAGGTATISGDVDTALELRAQGNVTFANISSTEEVEIRTNGAIVGRDVTAATSEIVAGGSIQLRNVVATATDGDAGDGLAILARGDVTLASAAAATHLEVYSVTGNIDAGSLSAPDYVVALAGRGIRVGTLTSNAPYLAGFATSRDPNFGDATDDDYSDPSLDFRDADGDLFAPDDEDAAAATLLAIAPSAAAGPITIARFTGRDLVAASASTVEATTAGSLLARQIVAPVVRLSVGGDFVLPATVQATDSLTVIAGGAISTGALNLNSAVDLEAGGAVVTGPVTMRNPAGGSVFLSSDTAGVTVNGDIRNADAFILAAGDVRFGNILTDTDAEVNVYANGSVTGGDVRAAEIEIAGRRTVDLGNLVINDAPDPGALHLDGLAVLGGGNVTLASATSRNRAELYSIAGDIKAGQVAAPELVVALAGGGIDLAAVSSSGPVYLAGFDTTRTGARAADGTAIFIDTGNFATLDLPARANVNLFNPLGPAAGAATLAGLLPVAASGAISARALTTPTFIAASGASVTATAPGALTARYVSAPVVDLVAGGLLSVTGSVIGGMIALTSADIAIGATASLGNGATRSLRLIASSNAVTVGGSATGGERSGYRLDAGEAAAIEADTVALSAPGTGGAAPTVTLDSIQLEGSLASDGTSSISVTTPGSVNVVGKIEMTNAAAGDVLAITAGNQIRVATPGAGIRLRGGDAASGGTLRLDAGTILVASEAAAQDLATAMTSDARNARLARNDGPAVSAGFLEAGAITLAASKSIYVQNSGTAATGGTGGSAAGLTAGAGGLTLTTTSSDPASPVEVILFGRQANAGGDFLTGGALIPATRLTGRGGSDGQGGAANLASASTINGCLISSGGAGCGIAAVTLPMAIANVADVVNAVVDATSESNSATSSTKALVSAPTITTVTLMDFAPLTAISDIDSPLTGIGNEDFWQGIDERKRRDAGTP